MERGHDLSLFDERAGIAEYDGGMARLDAEVWTREYVAGLFSHQDAPTILSEPLPLRGYQQEAVTAVMASLARGEHPVVDMATGSGKSLVIAALCARLPGRVLVVTHRKKLLSQNSAALTRYLGQHEDIGVYSAGLEQRDTAQRVIFGGVQSIYKRMDELSQAGSFDHIISDEAHLVGNPGEDILYTAVLSHNLDARRIGLSATPTRMGMPIWGQAMWFTHCVYTAGIEQLTPAYLAPLCGVLSAHDVDLSAVRIKAGEFVQADASQAMSEERVAMAAMREILDLAQHRKHWALFCCDIAHTRLVARLLQAQGIPCGVMLSDQASTDNDEALRKFEAGETRALASCVMMTTGFDIPALDCVVLLRPTMSKELLIQMMGRGTRLVTAKSDCLILDYAGNLERHAPLDALARLDKTYAREVQDAEKAAQARAARERQARHSTTALPGTPTTWAVRRMGYAVLPSRKRPGTSLLRVTYRCTGRTPQWVTLWLCPEYPGWPRLQAELWFERRGLPCPQTAAEACRMAQEARRVPRRITVIPDGQWDRVTLEFFDE